MSLVCLLPFAGCNFEAQRRSQQRAELGRDIGRLLSEGKLEEAFVPLDRAIGLTPTDLPDPGKGQHVDLLLLKAELLQNLGRRDESRLYVERARGVDPGRSELILLEAMQRLDRGESEEALALLDETLGRSPANPSLLLERGLLLLNISDPVRAEPTFAELIQIVEYTNREEERPREEGVAHLGLAVSQAAQRPGDGVDEFLEGVDIAKGDALPILAQFSAAGYSDSIAQLTREACAAAPNDPALGPIQAGLLLTSKDTSGAIREVERSLATTTDTAKRVELMMIAAQAAGVEGRPDESLVWIRRGLDEDATNLSLLEFLAIHALQLGARPADMTDLQTRIEQATLTIEDPQQLARIEDLVRRIEAAQSQPR